MILYDTDRIEDMVNKHDSQDSRDHTQHQMQVFSDLWSNTVIILACIYKWQVIQS